MRWKSLGLFVAFAAATCSLAVAQRVAAEVVYSDAIPPWQPNGLYHQLMSLDLNGDGKVDTTLIQHLDLIAGAYRGPSMNEDGDAVQYGNGIGATALPAGVEVGPQSAFGHTLALWEFSGDEGLDLDWYLRDQYLGMRFTDVAGATHYGWVHFAGPAPFDNVPVSFAYETTPNTALATGVPEPGGTALLVVVAPALLRRRR